MPWLSVVIDWTGRLVDSSLAMGLMRGVPVQRSSDPDTDLTALPGANLAKHQTLEMTGPAETGPFRDSETGLAVVADATLHNRNEVSSELGLPLRTPISEILARGFARWGTGLPARLVGDFAFVVWDWRKREFFAARDPFGVRSLVYRRGAGGTLILATDVEQLLPVRPASLVPDPTTILEYLTWDYRETDRTFFRNISRVPPGHFFYGTASGTWISRYWRTPTRQVALAGTEEYYREFRRLFFRAVDDRLESDQPVLVHLSGGIDSSSIVCAANEMARGGRRNAVKAISAVHPGLACDETPFIEAVRRRISIPHETWNGALPIWSDLENPTFAWPAGHVLHSGGTRGGIEIAVRDGAVAILGGTGGDQLGSSLGILRDLAAGHRWGRLLRETVFGRPGTARQKVGRTIDAASGAAPAWVLAAYRRMRASLPREWPRWLSADLKAMAGVRPEPPIPVMRPFFSHLQQRRWVALNAPVLGWSIERQRREAAINGIEMRFPFLDVRLVTFLLGVPVEHWRIGDHTERFQRDALMDLLPPEVVARRQKANFQPAVRARVRAGLERIRHILFASNWASAPYVDQRSARDLLVACERGQGTSFWDDFYLLRIATLEAWLRRVLG